MADMTALEDDEYTVVMWDDNTYGKLREAD